MSQLNPGPNEPHKDVRLGEAYELPDGTSFTPHSVAEVADEAAALDPETNPEELTSALMQQVEQDGGSAGKLPVGYDFRLSPDTSFGSPYTPPKNG